MQRGQSPLASVTAWSGNGCAMAPPMTRREAGPLPRKDCWVLMVMLLHGALGFIVHPDFATGEAASTKEVLWVEFNAWHALAGFLLGLPALAALAHARWAVAMAGYLAVALTASGIWIAADHDAAGFVPFGDAATGDAIYHWILGDAYATGAIIGLRRLRPPPRGRA